MRMTRPNLTTIKILLIIGLVGSAIALGVAANRLPAAPSAITWERDYAKAVQRAQAEKKLIVADMFTDWCVLCKKMDAETFSDPQLIKDIANKYVWLKLNTETEEDGKRLQKDFAILTYPTTLVLDRDGEEVDRIGRFLPATEFTETVQSFAHSPGSLASLRKGVQEQPSSVSAHYALAEKLLDQNNYAKAVPEFEKVIALDPDNHEHKTDLSEYNVALCLASQNQFVQAIAALDVLQERFPKSTAVADSAVLRGQIYHCCNELDKAQAVLRDYVDKYPGNGHIQEVENLLSAMEAETGGK
jgi:tetratricopeptide (TPR) repeat protein